MFLSQNRNENKLKNRKNKPMKNYKEMLLKENSYEIMNFYLYPYNKNAVLKQGKNISNPFIKEKQKTPSFNIYFSKRSQTWLYHDFATGDRGNCIELVKHLFKLPFKEAIEKIQSDLRNLVSNASFPLSSENKTAEKQNISPIEKLPIRDFSAQELDYWAAYGVINDILKEYNVLAIEENFPFKENRSGNPFKPTFAYKYGNALKIYKPYSIGQRFFFKGTKPENFYFGFEQLPDSGEYIIITGGEKDVLTLKAHGFPAICLNSETALPTESLLKLLKERFDEILVLYDTDITGITKSQQLAKDFSLIRIELPLKEGLKDISDFFKAKYPAKELESLIDSAVKKNETVSLKEKQAPWTNIANSPLIGENIYKNLPLLLQDICMVQKDRRSRDSVLISALATLSGCLPNVFGEYGGRTYFPNFYSFIIAPPASGKGNLGLLRYLLEEIHQSILNESNERYKRYKEEQKLYKDSKCKEDMAEPVKPEYRIFLVPANSSYAAMIAQIDQNKANAIIFDTEADAVGNAFKQEWGNYSEALRKFWQHETVSSLRKQDMKYIDIPEGKVSVILSGTPNQVIAIIKSAEDGLLSRFAFYVFTGDPVWLDVSPEGNKTNLTEHYKQCGKKVKDMYDQFIANPCEIKLTQSQWEQLNTFGDRSLKDVHTFLTEEALSIPKRLGVVLFRITMILTCIRAFETNLTQSEIQCCDEDFQTALALCEVLLEHAKLVYVNLPKVAHTLDPMKQKLYDLLPFGWFTAKEVVEKGKLIRIAQRTASGYVTDFCTKGLIEKGKQGEYFKPPLPSLPSLPGAKVA